MTAERIRMTCKQAVGLLGDFLEATLGRQEASDLERHLEGCQPCRAYLATYKKTKELAGRAGRAEMPAEMKARVRRFLLRTLRDR
jgi:anti-sigma factor RsiW